MLKLIVEEIDAETGSVIKRAGLDVEAVAEIEDCIGMDFEGDEAVVYTYEISAADLGTLKERFGLHELSGCRDGRIRRRVRLDDLPYPVHTGSEVFLMLKGEKPMAYFSFRAGDDPEIREEVENSFAPYVESGRIRRFEAEIEQHRRDGSRVCLEYLIFTLPEEIWRAKALVSLKEAGSRSGWSEGMERMEGSLLGYSDQQNDVYIAQIFQKLS